MGLSSHALSQGQVLNYLIHKGFLVPLTIAQFVVMSRCLTLDLSDLKNQRFSLYLFVLQKYYCLQTMQLTTR